MNTPKRMMLVVFIRGEIINGVKRTGALMTGQSLSCVGGLAALWSEIPVWHMGLVFCSDRLLLGSLSSKSVGRHIADCFSALCVI